jgi:hypothetical protein
MKKTTILTLVLCALALGCGEPPKPETPQKPPEPKYSPEVTGAAETVLGDEAEILLVGDLARTGQEHVLAINRLKATPKTTVPGTLLTRAAILTKEGGKWKEIFRCDEHLKNPKGYLVATPIAPVSGWRLQFEQHADKGLVMYFTPLAQPVGGYILTIGVRWNPKAKRYQSLDRNYENFLGETPVLETPSGGLR